MRKALLSLMAMLLIVGGVSARPVGIDKARRVAETYMNAKGMKNVAALQNVTAQTPFTEFYVFAAPEGGFILVSADDCVVPVLGYAVNIRFETKDMPAHVRSFLEGYEKEIRYWKHREAVRGNLRAKNASSPVAHQWQMLYNGQMPPVQLTTAVAPLLTTTWGQRPLYNNLCPFDSSANKHVVTGCVATATAQVMKYWNHPTTGYGSHTYTSQRTISGTTYTYGPLTANYGNTTYQWSNMPNALTDASSDAQVNAVATLMYHIGVADEMMYSPNAAGAWNQTDNTIRPSSQTSLVSYFKYRPDITLLRRGDCSDAEYCARLRAELDQNRPILFSGSDISSGHSFVLHGYDNNGLFRVNWGWRGSYDGYYAIGALNPGESGDGGTATSSYNLENAALLGIRPNTSWSSTASMTVAITNNNAGGNNSITGDGTYSFGDTVTMMATSAAGYRFAGWADGDRSNPRFLIARGGGSYSFTGSFTQLQGDTLGYCEPYCAYLTRFSVNNQDNRWGIRLPASVLPVGHYLTSAELYVGEEGTYTLQVFTGVSSPTTMVASSSPVYFGSDGIDQWHTFDLNFPVAVDGTQTIWISFTCPDATWPASVTSWCGNNAGFCMGSNMTAYGNKNSFMIRGIFSQETVPSGDTISYCGNEPFASGIGTGGGALHWGIMLPAANLVGHNYLKSVMVYVQPEYTGTYTLNLYTGGDTVPGSLTHTQTVSFGSADTGWQEVTLSSIFPLSSQNLWITFYTIGLAYPISVCAYSGSVNSDWISLDGTSWSHATDYNLDYSWMIKAVCSDTVPPQDTTTYTITVLDNGLSPYGTVSGGGSFHYGDTTVIMAFDGGSTTTGYGAHFVRWNDGNTNAMRSIIVTGNATYVAIFEPTGGCPSITDFPYHWGLEGTLGCWTAIDANNDSSTWRPLGASSGIMPHSGIGMAASFSYTQSAVNANEYLVSPQIQIPAGHSATLSWWFQVHPSYPEDKLAVKVSTTGTAVSDFTTTVFDITPTAANGIWTQQTVDLSAYAGQSIYVAFHHHDSYDAYYLLLDDIEITVDTMQTAYYLVSVNSNNPAWGTVTGAGSYASGATATLTATANSGYHFVEWQDGNIDNPRTITVTGNATYTATFAADAPNPPAGDTISYCLNSPLATAINAGGSPFDWAVMFPASTLTGRNYLKSVLAYVLYDETYTVSIYSGGDTLPGTLLHSQTAVFDENHLGWQEILLDATVSIPSGQNLWVVLNSTIAAVCAHTEDVNSDWLGLGDNTWMHLYEASSTLYYSWMIKAVTSATVPTLPAPTVSISGPTVLQVGQSGTFTAVATAGTTVNWSLNGATPSTATGNTVSASWSIPGTYAVVATVTNANGTGSDTLYVDVISCSAINTFPYTMSFNDSSLSDLACWTNVDNDGDGYSWTTEMFYNGIASASYINGVGALTPDNWLITPPVQLASGQNYTLSWHVLAADDSYFAEHYGVYVSTTTTALSSFTPLQQYTLASADETTVSLDLSSYAGQTVYLAFRHFNCTDQYWLILDSITIVQSSTPATYYTLTVNSNDATMGTVTGGGSYLAGSTATLVATPNAGYRFTGWQDGNTDNPRIVTVTANATYTAFFEATGAVAHGDTISYCDNNPMVTYITAGGSTFDRAIMFPGSTLTGRNYLKSVMAYVAIDETYTVKIYRGGDTVPGTLVHTQTAIFDENHLGWQEILLDATVSLPAGQNLWVVLTSTAGATCSHTGDVNSDWLGLGGYWLHLYEANASLYYSWMIKAVTSATAPALPAPTVAISGYDQVAVGSPITFEAVGTAGAAITWSFQGGSPAAAAGTTATTTFATPGIHNVIATVTNAYGTGRDTLRVRVVDYAAGDTVSYCLDRDFVTNVGTGSAAPLSWGIMLPAAYLAHRDQIDKVLLYTVDPGAYTLRVYQGGDTVPGTLVHSQLFNITAADTGYKVLTPSQPITLDKTQNLWIVFHTDNIAYPAASGDYTGDVNSDWITLNDTSWVHMSDYGLDFSWLIKVVTSQAAPVYRNVTVVSMMNDGSEVPSSCTVTGAGSFVEGSTVTLTASSTEPYSFDFFYWINAAGDTIYDNPYLFTLNSDVNIIAVFGYTGGISGVDVARVKLYPNPAVDRVSLSGLTLGARITLIDASGRHLDSWSATEEEMTLDVSRLAAGQYFLRISSDGQTVVKKLVIE